MTLIQFESVTGFLTLATAVFTIALAIPVVRGHLTDATAGGLAVVISGGATLGSLALSEVFGLVPCELCWYQRVFMYPLPVVIGLALWVRSSRAWISGVALAAIGAAFSVYHLVVQWVPGVGSCSVDNPCSSRIFDAFGFVSIPAMALVAFAGTIASLVVWRGAPRAGGDTRSHGRLRP